MNKDLWKDKRSKNIGGSEIAALFGQCPYKSYYELWHEKAGNIKPSDISEDERVLAGQYLEEGILKLANRKWDLDFYQPHVYYEHATVKGMGCTPDALSASNPEIMAQVKNVDSLQFSLQWDYEGDIITKAPLHIQLQVHHELEVANKEMSYLIVMVGGNRIMYMPIMRDKELCEVIIHNVSMFWDSIKNKEEPEPDYKIDKNTIKKVRKTLKARDYEDFSDDEKFYLSIEKLCDRKADKKKLEDTIEELEAMVYYLSLNTKSIKCRNFRVEFTDIPAVPDQVITEKHIGQIIKGRAASTRLKIINEEIAI